MPVDWTSSERASVDEGIRKHPVRSGRCAALARVVVAVGRQRDESAGGRLIRPRSAARFVIPKGPQPPTWYSHTFGVAHQHAVDALTGADGCVEENYLGEHWQHLEYLQVDDVDVELVDPGIQDVQGAR
jgi:hypothetical protein